MIRYLEIFYPKKAVENLIFFLNINHLYDHCSNSRQVFIFMKWGYYLSSSKNLGRTRFGGNIASRRSQITDESFCHPEMTLHLLLKAQNSVVVIRNFILSPYISWSMIDSIMYSVSIFVRKPYHFAANMEVNRFLHVICGIQKPEIICPHSNNVFNPFLLLFFLL